MKLALAVIAVTGAGGLGLYLAACTSGTTPNCDGGVCGYEVPETGPEEAGPEEAGDASGASDATDSGAIDSSAETSAPPDAQNAQDAQDAQDAQGQ
jgi:hypothetical protein